MGKIIDGKKIALNLKENLKKEVEFLKKKDVVVCLCVILVGDDPASRIYVNSKKRTCEELGIVSKEIILKEDVGQDFLVKTIQELNEDASVNGILVQLPLPKNFDEEKIINVISPFKDVDCFNLQNVAKLMTKNFCFVPCTPAGIISLIKETNVNLEGKNCVIVGRSNIVGKPMFLMMLNENATVTICHSKTSNLNDITKKADILIVAIGKANFIDKSMVKEGAIVIDVGINRLENKKIVGDVLFDEVEKIAGFITPVPGGVGPMTVVKLMENVINAAKMQNNII